MAYQSEIEKLEQRYHENPQQWFAALADSYRKVGDLDLALEVVRGGLEKRPNYASGHIVLGRCLLDKQVPEEAALSFEQVLELDAENIIALKSLGDIAEQKSDFTGAKQWLTRLLDIDPMNEEARESIERIGDAETALPEEEETPESEESGAEEAVPEAPAIEPGAAWATEAMAEIDRGETAPAEPSAVAEAEADEPAETEPQPPAEEPAVAEQPVVEAESPPVGDEGFAIERTSWDDSQGAAALEAPSEETAGVFGDESGTEAKDEPATIEPIEGLEATAAEPVEVAETVETVETVESTTPPEGGQVRLAGDLEVVSFDEELSWGAGDSQSAAISGEDLLETEAQHEDLAPAVEFLGDPEAVVAREELEAREGGEEGEGDVAAEVVAVEEEVPAAAAWTDEPAGSEPSAPAVLERPAEALGLDDYPAVAEGATAEAAWTDEPADPEPVESAEVFEATERGEVAEVAATSEAEEVVPVGTAEPDEPAWAAGSNDLPLIMPEDVTPRAEEAGEMEPVVTETMAEVYAKQGLYEQARETYEKLLQQRPGDPALEQKLAEISQQVDTEVAGDTSSRFSISATGGESAVAFLQSVFQTGTAVEAEPAPQVEPAAPDVPTESVEPAALDVPTESVAPAEADATYEPVESVAPAEVAVPDESAAPDEESASVLESAFGDEPDEPPGSPTIPASDEVSLSSVFGGEPPAPPGDSLTNGEASGGMDSVSFDEFYGAGTEAPAEGESTDAGEEDDESSDDDFRNWLEGLKT